MALTEYEYADERAAVSRGAALLDEKKPGWEKIIDMAIFNGSFDMGSWSSCVVGNLEMVFTEKPDGGYYGGTLGLGIALNGEILTEEREAAHYGFYPLVSGGGSVVGWPGRLSRLWREEVHKRLGKEAASSEHPTEEAAT